MQRNWLLSAAALAQGTQADAKRLRVMRQAKGDRSGIVNRLGRILELIGKALAIVGMIGLLGGCAKPTAEGRSLPPHPQSPSPGEREAAIPAAVVQPAALVLAWSNTFWWTNPVNGRTGHMALIGAPNRLDYSDDLHDWRTYTWLTNTNGGCVLQCQVLRTNKQQFFRGVVLW